MKPWTGPRRAKYQGQCGSCWAFSTTGSPGGASTIADGNMLPLCEQELVDCVTVDSSCNGELMDNAFIFAKNIAIYTEGTYPYTAQDETCSFSDCRVDILHGGVGRVRRRVH